MIQIKNNQNKYYQKAIDATIINNTIIPGISGLEVDILNSYSKMKKVGKYQESLLIFKKVDSNISIKNNQDKLIISGNPLKKQISILLKIDNIEIIKSLKKESYLNNLNFIFDKNFLIKEEIFLKNLNNNIVILEDQIFNSNLIDYCYTSLNFKNLCKNYLKYTFKVEFITSNYYYNTYQKIQNGSLIGFLIKDKTDINNLNILIQGINNLGFKIVSLDELITE